MRHPGLRLTDLDLNCVVFVAGDASGNVLCDSANFIWNDAANALVIGGNTAVDSATLQLDSTTKGFLAPRMTSIQRDSITAIEGLLVYNTTDSAPSYYDGSSWLNLGTGSGGTGTSVVRAAFTNSSLTGTPSDTLTIAHGLGEQYSDVSIFNNLNNEIPLFEVTMNNSNTSTLVLDQSVVPITGTWNYAIMSGAAGVAAGGDPSIANVVEDTTPQLGGALDVNGNQITSASNGPILICPDGTGAIQMDSGGNTRGTNAVDLQKSRANSTEVASGDRAFIAGGEENTASGNNSHAEGYRAIASGSNSHAEGYNTTASGYAAHTEGNATIASNNSSHAEGDTTRANGAQAHAEGYSTIASGQKSHAEGLNTAAVGYASHAEGSLSNSSGLRAHAEGISTIANANYSHAEGNATRTGNPTRTFTVSGTTVTISGIDVTSEFSNSDTATFWNLSGGSNNTTFEARRTISSVSFSTNTTFTISSGIDDRTGGDCVVTANGVNSHAEGQSATASGLASHAEGSNSTASGNYSHAEGSYTTASDNDAHAEGNNTTASGDFSHAEGNITRASGSTSHSEGRSTVASGNYSHAEGYTTVAPGVRSHAEGSGSEAPGLYAHAQGNATTANGDNSHSEGNSTRTGNLTRACTISGTTVTVSGVDVTGEFSNSDVATFWNLTGGSNNTEFAATRTISSVAFDSTSTDTTFTITTIDDRTAGDCVVTANGLRAHAEGFNTIASGSNSHAEGRSTTASAGTAHAEGYSTTASANQAHAEGYNTTASSNFSHAEGQGTEASGTACHAEGLNTTATTGTAAHAEGNATTASANHAHAEGSNTTASGSQGHAEGNRTTASGTRSHAGGHYAVAPLTTQWSRASGRFGADGDAQHSIIGAFRSVNNTTSELTITGASPSSSTRILIPTDAAWFVNVSIIARETSGANHAIFLRKLIIENTSGTTALVGSVETLGTDTGSNGGIPPANWSIAITADNTNDSLVIDCTNSTSTDVRFLARLDTTELIFA